MSQTVRGVIARSANAPVEVIDVVIPDPGPGEVVVDIIACGVCHTDLTYREGGINDEFPFLLGHEAAGIAPEDMDDVAGSAVALAASEPDTVAVLGYLWPGGVEGEQQLGARELPEEVRAFYESYGKAVMAAP